jgi:hypothetical protein
MAEYQITYWQEIPSLVTAREGRRNRASVELSQRFQVAIDEAAMRAGMTGTESYMEQWRRSAWQEREGTPETVAAAVAVELEAEYSPERIREILSGYRDSA